MTILLLARVWHPCLYRDSWIRICKQFYHLEKFCEIHTLAVFEVDDVSKRFMKCRANTVFYVLLTQVDEVVHEMTERHLGLSVRFFFQFHLLSSRLRSQFSFDCSMSWISKHRFFHIFLLLFLFCFPFFFSFMIFFSFFILQSDKAIFSSSISSFLTDEQERLRLNISCKGWCLYLRCKFESHKPLRALEFI